MLSDEVRDAVLRRIDREELAELALTLGQIDSPPGLERAVGEYLYQWLSLHGFSTHKVGMFDDRFNVMGIQPGKGRGYSLLFNSHMDTSPVPDFARGPQGEIAWRDDKNVLGWGIVNDKGPMAAFMAAGKAIKEAGVDLLGDLLLTMVVGETGNEPVDEFQGGWYLGKDAGARYLVTHGGVADYAIVAEATNFKVSWTEAGKAFFKVTVRGHRGLRYTPYYVPAEDPAEEINSIVQASRLIEAIHQWGREYTQRHVFEGSGGKIIPRVNIGAIRAGRPYHITTAPAECQLYLDVRIVPGQDVLQIKDELRNLMTSAQVPGEVELFLFRPAYEARNVEPLVEALQRAHERHFGEKLALGDPIWSSMWRDINIFNEVGIPTIMYAASGAAGGSNLAMPIEDLFSLAKVYALVSLEVCLTPKPASG